MPGIKIDELKSANALTKDDLIVVVQDGNTLKATIDLIEKFADKHVSDIKSNISILSDRIETIEETDPSSMVEELNLLKLSASTNATNIDENKAACDSLQVEIDEINEKLTNIDELGNVVGLITSVNELSTNLSSIPETVASLEDRIAIIEDRINSIKLNYIPKWYECTKSSNWAGTNGEVRFMDLLNPTLNASEDYFITSADFLLNERKVNTVNFILANEGDGSLAGYSIYGSSFTSDSMEVSPDFIEQAKEKLNYFANRGIGIVLWLMTKNSATFNSILLNNFDKYCEDIKNNGLFDFASTVVLGLELDNYISGEDTESKISDYVDTLKKYYSGKIGTNYSAYSAIKQNDGSDILFYQYQLTSDHIDDTIPNNISSFIAETGKDVNCFEIRNYPVRTACMEVFDRTLAYGVGNW